MKRPGFLNRWATYVVVAYFALAGTAVGLYQVNRTSRDADREFAEQNRELALQNRRRSFRNCERVLVIVSILDRLAPEAEIEKRLDAVDAKYPDVPPCRAR